MASNEDSGSSKFYNYFNWITSGSANIASDLFGVVSRSVSQAYRDSVSGPYSFAVLNVGANCFKWSIDGIAAVPGMVDSAAQAATSGVMRHITTRPGCSAEDITKRSESLKSLIQSSTNIQQELSHISQGLDCINFNPQTLDGAITAQQCHAWNSGQGVVKKISEVVADIEQAYNKEIEICASKEIVQNPLLSSALEKHTEAIEAEHKYRLEYLELNKRIQNRFYCSSIGTPEQQKLVAGCAQLTGDAAKSCYSSPSVQSIFKQYQSLSIPIASQDRNITFNKCAGLIADANKYTIRAEACERAIEYNDKIMSSHSGYAGDRMSTYAYVALVCAQWFVIASTAFVLLGKAAVYSFKVANYALKSVNTFGRRVLGDGVMNFFEGLLSFYGRALSYGSKAYVRYKRWDFWTSLREHRLYQVVKSSDSGSEVSDDSFGLGTPKTRRSSSSSSKESEKNSGMGILGILACAAAALFAVYSLGMWFGYLWERFVIGDNAIELSEGVNKKDHQKDVCSDVESEPSCEHAPSNKKFFDRTDALHREYMNRQKSENMSADHSEDEGFVDYEDLHYSTYQQTTRPVDRADVKNTARARASCRSDDTRRDGCSLKGYEEFAGVNARRDDSVNSRPFSSRVKKNNEQASRYYPAERDCGSPSEDDAYLSDAYAVPGVGGCRAR